MENKKGVAVATDQSEVKYEPGVSVVPAKTLETPNWKAKPAHPYLIPPFVGVDTELHLTDDLPEWYSSAITKVKFKDYNTRCRVKCVFPDGTHAIIEYTRLRKGKDGKAAVYQLTSFSTRHMKAPEAWKVTLFDEYLSVEEIWAVALKLEWTKHERLEEAEICYIRAGHLSRAFALYQNLDYNSQSKVKANLWQLKSMILFLERAT